MNKEPANKRRRLERAPPKITGDEVADVLPSHLAANCIDTLPDAVLQYCFSFIGKGHYRYVAGTSRRFNEIYRGKHEKKTTLKSIAASVSSAELHLQDGREQYKESTNYTLQIIFLNAALIGNVKVLKWARGKGFDPEADDFMNASLDGHVAVVQWADDNDLDWFSDTFIDLAAQMGHACILEWAHSTGRAIPVSAAVTAASFGQCVVLTWMKEHDLLGSIQDLWRAASVRDHIDVLDWLFDNGYRVHPDVISISITSDRRNVLLWAREHGLAWDASTCALAAIGNDLSLLQWLRENDCPWDRIVIAAARGQGFEDIAQWAIDNGCPTE